MTPLHNHYCRTNERQALQRETKRTRRQRERLALHRLLTEDADDIVLPEYNYETGNAWSYT